MTNPETNHSPVEGGNSGYRLLVTLASLVVLIAALKVAQDILLPLVVAGFLAVLGAPAVRYLEQKRVPKSAAVPLVLLVIVLVLFLFGLVIGGSVGSFTEKVPAYKVRINDMTAGLFQWLQGLGVKVDSKSLISQISPGSVMSVFGSTLSTLASAFSTAMLVVLLVVFMMFEAAGFPEKLAKAFGDVSSRMEEAQEAATKVHRYLWIKTVISLGTGACVTVLLWAFGVDFPFLWGLCAFLLNFIPNIGSLIAAVPPVMLSLVQFGFGRTLWVGIGFFAINFVFGNMVEPKMLGKELGLSPLVVFLALVVFGWLWGPVGMLLSTPLTVVIQIMLARSPEYSWVSVMLGPTPDAEPGVEEPTAAPAE